MERTAPAARMPGKPLRQEARQHEIDPEIARIARQRDDAEPLVAGVGREFERPEEMVKLQHRQNGERASRNRQPVQRPLEHPPLQPQSPPDPTHRPDRERRQRPPRVLGMARGGERDQR
jgi:hypothetical protein